MEGGIWMDARDRLFAESERPIMKQLAKVGYAVSDIGELKNMTPFDAAVPVLLNGAKELSFLPVWESVVDVLGRSRTQKAGIRDDLFAFIKDPPKLEDPQAPMSSDEIRAFMMFRLGAALADLMEPVDADRYLSVAADPSAGDARRMILRNLGKLRDGRALNVLVRALKDSDVAAPAIGGLGRLRTVPASELIGHIEPLLESPDENVRDEARRVLRQLRKRSN